jgi:hypothetical protein
MAKDAGTLETRIRNWLSAHNTAKLTQEDIFDYMNEAGDELVELFDIWFCRVWGSITRSSTNAIWDSRSIPAPRATSGAQLSAGQIAAGTSPVNIEYLRALPYPEGLLRPTKVFWGSISNDVELAYLYEEEFYAEYPMSDESSGGATPVAYTLTGDSILLGPTPTFAATLNVFGFYKPQELESEDDTNEFTRYGHRLLVYHTQNLLIKYQYEEESRADLFRPEYSKALKAALAQSGRQDDLVRQSVLQRKA